MIPPIFGGTPGFPLITPRELAIQRHRPPGDRAVPADQLGCHVGLEFIERAAVQDAFQHLADVVAHAMIGRQQVVEIRRLALGRARVAGGTRLVVRQARDVLPHPVEAVGVVFGTVVGDGAHRRVGLGAAQRFGVDRLAGGALDEVGTAQAHERGAIHHEDHVRQRRQIRATGDARSHHGGELRHVQVAPHDRVVIEDARGAVLPRENAALVWQIHAGRVDQIDDRDALAHRDLLRAQDFLDRFGPPAARFDGRIVRHHDHGPPVHAAHAGHHARAGRLAVVLIVGDEQTHFEPRSARVEQARHPLARRELFLFVLALDLVRPPPCSSRALRSRYSAVRVLRRLTAG